MSRTFLICFCGVMLALNAFSCDILLPAFFAIESDLGTSIERVQLLIPLYLIAAAAGQIVFGPASDRFGRRPVLVVGLAVYIGGCLLSALAPTIDVLQAARFVQGFGAACAVVLARTILRDTHSGDELARALALSMAIFAIGPLTAPLAGTGLVALGGWRGAFVALTVLGCLLLAAALLGYKETNLAPNPQALAPTTLLSAAKRFLSHPQSRYFLVLAAFLQLTIVLLIASAPRVFRSAFGLTGLDFALPFAIAATGIVIGQLISNRAIARIGVLATTRTAAAVLALVVLALAALATTGQMTPFLLMAFLFIFNMSFLVIFANCASLILEPHRDIAGTASSLLGCLTQLSGSLAALAVLPYLDGTLTRWSLVQLLPIGVIVVGVWLYQPPRGDPVIARG